MTNQTKTFVIVLVFLAVIALIFLAVQQYHLVGTNGDNYNTGSDVSTTTQPSNATTTDKTTSDGTITFERPVDFALAVTAQQVTVQAYIPPCDPDFNYCLFYNGTAYQGSNFESAGVSLRKRLDLTSSNTCLSTQPAGYSGLTRKTASSTSYTISSFAPVGDAATGHSASGEEYHVFTNNTCYQIDTRIGQTQFDNYPVGTITQFTREQQADLLAQLRAIVSGIRINVTGEQVVLPL